MSIHARSPTSVQYLVSGHKVALWSLYGHLSASSLYLNPTGTMVKAGQRIGVLGETNENGGWPPHLHFQLSWCPPEGHDMPGVVAVAQRARGRWTFPDPRLVLGTLY